MRYVLSDIRNSIYRELTDRAKEGGIIDNLAINDRVIHHAWRQLHQRRGL